MATSWREVKISDICDIVRGGSPRPIQDFFVEDGIPWLKIADATFSDRRYITETRQFIKKEGLSKTREVFDGDLVLSNSATPGIPRFMKIYACIHDGWLLLRNFREIDKEFFYYLLIYERPKLLQQGNGSIFTNLKTEILKNHKVRIPPIRKQKLIAQSLGDLDNKIDLNSQLNQTLEAMAQALFKSWFTDFDPVIDNALAAGNPIPEPFKARAERRRQRLHDSANESSSPLHPLPTELRQLFPDAFQETEELGWVPQGWKPHSIDELVDLIGGGTPKTSVDEYWGGSIPWFSVVDAPAISDVFVIETEKYITELGLEKSSTKLLPAGTTIISARGTVGKCAMAGVPMAMNQSCYGVRGRDSLSDFFVYYMVLLNVSDLQQRGHGSVFNTITRDTFASLKFHLPSAEVREKFDSMLNSKFDKIKENLKQQSVLKSLRDSLLPKLLSGQLRIPDAEAQLAEAGL